MLRRILLTALFACVLASGFAKGSKQTADSIANLLNRKGIGCDKACPLFGSEKSNAGLVNTIFIDVLAVIGTVWLYSSYKKKYFFVIGAAVVIIVTGTLVLKKKTNACVEYSQSSCQIVASTQHTPTAANSGLDDFQPMDSASADTSSVSTAEFSSMDTPAAPSAPTTSSFSVLDSRILDPMIAFALLAFVGLGMRYPSFVRFRGLFLLAGVAWFGFYRGGCTCMISSFQDLILGIGRWQFAWINLIWMLVLIVATYLFGRVWCGWLCHLGAIQDLLFHSSKLKILTSKKSQDRLRIVRYVIFMAWILQLLLMKRNLYCEYDPFKALFNMIFTDAVSLSLLLLLLVSSVLIYRPFCRMVCPVGVLLGFVSKIPGARKIRVNSQCVNCGLCTKECAMHAVHRTSEKTEVDTEHCIACGECTTVCRKDGIKPNLK